MVYKLKPLEVGLEFEDRTYRLGDTINVTVDLNPRGDVHVREARVDLVCQERYWENSTVSYEVPILVKDRAGMVRQMGNETVTKQINKEKKKHTFTAAQCSFTTPI
jgi:hypothetical protein